MSDGHLIFGARRAYEFLVMDLGDGSSSPPRAQMPFLASALVLLVIVGELADYRASWLQN